MDYESLGNAIRKKRLELNWKIAELADKANVSEDFIGKIERATDIPSLQTVIAIANALNVGTDYLLGNELVAVDAYLCDEISNLLDTLDESKRKLFLMFIRHNLKFFMANTFTIEESI